MGGSCVAGVNCVIAFTGFEFITDLVDEFDARKRNEASNNRKHERGEQFYFLGNCLFCYLLFEVFELFQFVFFDRKRIIRVIKIVFKNLFY